MPRHMIPKPSSPASHAKDVARRIKIEKAWAVKTKLYLNDSELTLMATDEIRRFPLKERTCMHPSCKTVFTSTGPHHRFCENCRDRRMS